MEAGVVIISILKASFFMFWEVFWPLMLGFFLSAVVQVTVSHKKMTDVLGNESPKSILLATLFGAASSSCSYAAIALARSIFTKGASFTSAMIFQLASTNLVIELGIILFVLLGWQFMAAEILGGIIMIVLLAIIFKKTLSTSLVLEAKNQANKEIAGKMEGHAHMDMSVFGSFWGKIFSSKGITTISHYFIMDIAAVWTDILLGFLIAGVLEVLVPPSFWHTFFFANNSVAAFIVGPLVGPIIAIISFVCSVGNIPLAAVLWQSGMSFGGVISFIFADLLVLPILDIYRKYYGLKMMFYLLGTFYAVMVLGGYLVEIIFSALNIIPKTTANLLIVHEISWNYTAVLNIVFLLLASFLFVRFIKTGGPHMLSMMNTTSSHMHH